METGETTEVVETENSESKGADVAVETTGVVETENSESKGADVAVEGKRKKFDDFIKNVAEILLMLVIAMLITSVLKATVLFRADVSGLSMYPTLQEGDSYFAAVHKRVEHGSIVVLRVEGLDYLLVKRVIGLPGDTISIDKNNVYLNGEALDESYVNNGIENGTTTEVKELVLGDDEYYVLGDNRAVSRDSRSFGVVKKKDILGVVLMF